jgi:hypothetical protein
MKTKGVEPLSTLGWDETTAAIKEINELEQSWDSVQKQPSGISAYPFFESVL